MEQWPAIRHNARFRLDTAVNVISPELGVVRGWCHDIGEGGMCGRISCGLNPGDAVTIELRLPNTRLDLRLCAVVKYARGSRYGFEFTRMDQAMRTRIAEFGRAQHTAAYILSPTSALVWSLQRNLQQVGVSHVTNGSPKDLPSAPHIIIVDSDWPEYAEVISFLRSESRLERPVVIIAMLSADANAGQAQRAGADLLLHKPLGLERTRKVLKLAYRMVTRAQAEAVASQP